VERGRTTKNLLVLAGPVSVQGRSPRGEATATFPGVSDDEPSVVSLAEARNQQRARAAEAARGRALEQTRVDPSALPKPWVTYVLLGINLAVWLVMVATGVDPWEPAPEALRDWGGNVGMLTAGGQWWRLLTAMFLHAGIFHIGFNLYFLWVIGRICEQIFGKGAYALVYFGSGLISSLVSAAWQPAVVSVGASGALFGVFGAFLGFTFRRRAVLPPEFVKSVRRNALVLIGINVAFSLAVPEIDVAAHVGGLLAGLGLGYMIAALAERPVDSPAAARRVRVRAVGLALLACVLVIAAGVLAIPRWDNPLALIDELGPRHMELMERYEATEDIDARARVIEADVLPFFAEAVEQMHGLQRVPRGLAELVESRTRYFELQQQAFERELAGLRGHDVAALQEAEQLHTQALAALD
jgi:membrane associated rhomboid family serine protease